MAEPFGTPIAINEGHLDGIKPVSKKKRRKYHVGTQVPPVPLGRQV